MIHVGGSSSQTEKGGRSPHGAKHVSDPQFASFLVRIHLAKFYR